MPGARARLAAAAASKAAAFSSPITAIDAAEDTFDGQYTLRSIIDCKPDMSLPVAAVQTLIEFVKQSRASTQTEFMKHLDVQANALKELPENRISMIAGCDLFFRFVTRHPAESDFEPWKAKIVQLGESMVQNCQSHRTSAAMSGVKFIKEDSVILVHSYSRVVMMLLKLAFAQCRFKVIVTDAKPSDSGRRAVAELRGEGIPAALINDAAVGTVIGKVDMVLVGAEGVVQNGGIINQVGTYQVAVVAKAVNKPVYCVTESYKFVQLFPLNQDDLPITSSMYFKDEDDNGEIKMSNTTIDFTPPAYISLIFTNVGVLTPSGVAEQLIQSM